jgi:hypothetical protein
MPLQTSGEISWGNVRSELGLLTSNFSLNSAESGTYTPINQNSEFKPNGDNPNAISEWYGYDHSVITTTTTTIAPWSLSSITFNDSRDVTSYMSGTTNASITTPWVDNSGNRLYLIDRSNRRIHQSSLSISNDVSSTITSVGISPQLTNFFSHLQLSDDGTKAYVLVSTREIRQHNLSTAWDITTMSVTPSSTLNYPSNNTTRGFCFSRNGEELYGLYTDTSDDASLVKWSLSTAWDLSTASQQSTSNIDSLFNIAPNSIALIVENNLDTLIMNSISSTVALRGGITTSDLYDSNTFFGSSLSYLSSSNDNFIYNLERSGTSGNFTWTLRQFNTNV